TAEPVAVRFCTYEHRHAGGRPQHSGRADVRTKDAVENRRLAGTRGHTDHREPGGIERVEPGQQVVFELADDGADFGVFPRHALGFKLEHNLRDKIPRALEQSGNAPSLRAHLASHREPRSLQLYDRPLSRAGSLRRLADVVTADRQGYTEHR